MSGCTFSAPQFDASIRLIERVASGKSATAEEPRATWLASVGDRGALLNPYLSGGLTVFANVNGDAIAFDGWTIRSIQGFGLSGPISVKGKDGERIFVRDGVQTRTDCDTWTRSGLNWEQVCANGDGQIRLDETGNIRSITMALGNKFGIVTLRVAN
ncbi:hypothetical protein OAV33_00325 [bacterium]|nr:hypothetical protein [bacterium]